MKRTALTALAAIALLVSGCENLKGIKIGGKPTDTDLEAWTAETVAAPAAETASESAVTQEIADKRADYAAQRAKFLAAENKKNKEIQLKMEQLQREPQFEIRTSLGNMIIKLYEQTPLHRENFTKLVNSHFYDSTLFHRVINGFMIQAGDPLTKNLEKADEWGTGGPGYTVPAEIVDSLTHKKGAIAAARRGDFVNPAKASSGSQFYIVQDSTGCSHLDGQYTIFGEVISGLNVIDQIAGVATDSYDRPLDPVTILSITPHTPSF